MIVHTIKTKAFHHTFHFAEDKHFERAERDGGGSAHMRLAHTVYDHQTRRFVKSRHGNLEMLNAHLVARRTTLNENDSQLVDDYA